MAKSTTRSLALTVGIAASIAFAATSALAQGAGTPAAGLDVTGLPSDFDLTFESRMVQAGEVSLHAVVGGEGPPVLLIGGWPQTWYAWREVMPSIAESFTVVAVDPRGTGLSNKPEEGYDSRTMANDFVALMRELGHENFAVVGHDIGMWTGYAMAHDHPDAVTRLAVIDAIIPGVSQSPPLIGPAGLNAFLWHFGFNRAEGVNEELVRGREDIYYGHQFDSKAASPDAISDEAVAIYVDALRDPDALRASFDYYRAMDTIMANNAERKATMLSQPVLAIGGERGVGEGVEREMRTIATDVTGAVIPGSGHFVPEEGPDALVEVLVPFLSGE